MAGTVLQLSCGIANLTPSWRGDVGEVKSSGSDRRADAIPSSG